MLPRLRRRPFRQFELQLPQNKRCTLKTVSISRLHWSWPTTRAKRRVQLGYGERIVTSKVGGFKVLRGMPPPPPPSPINPSSPPAMIKANVRGHVIDYAAIFNGYRNWDRHWHRNGGDGNRRVQGEGWWWWCCSIEGGFPSGLIIKSREWCNDQWSPIV